jgi:hypothetical protein
VSGRQQREERQRSRLNELPVEVKRRTCTPGATQIYERWHGSSRARTRLVLNARRHRWVRLGEKVGVERQIAFSVARASDASHSCGSQRLAKRSAPRPRAAGWERLQVVAAFRMRHTARRRALGGRWSPQGSPQPHRDAAALSLCCPCAVPVLSHLLACPQLRAPLRRGHAIQMLPMAHGPWIWGSPSFPGGYRALAAPILRGFRASYCDLV